MKKSIFFVILLFLSAKVFAHEVSFGAGVINLQSAGSSIEILFGYRFPLLSWFELGGDGFYSTGTEGDSNVTIFQLFLGPSINFSSNRETSPFLNFGLALRSGSVSPDSTLGDDPSGTGLGFSFGKRFPIMNGFIYRPTAGFIQTGTLAFLLQPFFFSFTF